MEKITMTHAESNVHSTVEGSEYRVDENGRAMVAPAHVEILRRFGWRSCDGEPIGGASDAREQSGGAEFDPTVATRKELFAFLTAHNIPASATRSTDELREKAIDFLTAPAA